MNCLWDKLKNKFKICFDEQNYKFELEGKNYIWAAPIKIFNIENENGCIHYELVKRGDLYFIEFHIETNTLPEDLVAEINKQFRIGKNLRKWNFTTYYSSKIWQSRTPVFCEEDVTEDVIALKTALGEIKNDSSVALKAKNSFIDKLKHCHCFTAKLPELATSNEINIPNVQRGFVWNPARCATLWDSILRKFPIGAVCLQINGNHADLLDGQQRITAIKLAFSKFADMGSCKQSVLWLELSPSCNSEKKFIFKVTTASQPWGYKETSKETENPTLSIAEKRNAVERCHWHENDNGKPYPYELFPLQSELPVPFTLLREWVWSKQDNFCFEGFKNDCRANLKEVEYSNNWLQVIGDKSPDENTWNEIVKAILELKDYELVVTNANNVIQDDISLFFARIGRGGVMPSEEEIAYSILKAKMDEFGDNFNFKKKIENIAQAGYTPPHRIASLLIRCFCSTENEFCRSSIFSEVQKICQTKGKKEEFKKFIEAEAGGLFHNVIDNLRMPKWHISRYCNYDNGNIFLYLLLSYRDDADSFAEAIRVAEYVHCFSSDPGRVFNYIRTTNVSFGIIRALRETYYGSSILQFPIPPDSFNFPIPPDSLTFDSWKEWLNNPQNQAAANLLKYGYNKANMYSILLFACQESLPDYAPNSEDWKDDVCPWDYDHILPRSWFNDITNFDDADLCIALKDSIGNLAPLDFSINRSLSDNDRDDNYPGTKDIQKKLCIEIFSGYNRDEFKKSDTASGRLTFINNTITRFCNMYSKWYKNFGIGFENILKPDLRYKIFKTLNLPVYYVEGGRQFEITGGDNDINWARPWLAVGCEAEYKGEKCLCCIASDGNVWEVGYRRHPNATVIEGDSNKWWFKCCVFDNPEDAEKNFLSLQEEKNG